MDTETAARRFAHALRDAWAARDIDRFTALYSEDAPFRGPFGAPEPAADHMRRAFALGEGDPEVWVGDPVVAGDRASVEWWGVVAMNGELHTFAGTAWL